MRELQTTIVLAALLVATACGSGENTPPAELTRAGALAAPGTQSGCEHYCECIGDRQCISTCESSTRHTAFADACVHVPCAEYLGCLVKQHRLVDTDLSP